MLITLFFVIGVFGQAQSYYSFDNSGSPSTTILQGVSAGQAVIPALTSIFCGAGANAACAVMIYFLPYGGVDPSWSSFQTGVMSPNDGKIFCMGTAFTLIGTNGAINLEPTCIQERVTIPVSGELRVRSFYTSTVSLAWCASVFNVTAPPLDVNLADVGGNVILQSPGQLGMLPVVEQQIPTVVIEGVLQPIQVYSNLTNTGPVVITSVPLNDTFSIAGSAWTCSNSASVSSCTISYVPASGGRNVILPSTPVFYYQSNRCVVTGFAKSGNTYVVVGNVDTTGNPDVFTAYGPYTGVPTTDSSFYAEFALVNPVTTNIVVEFSAVAGDGFSNSDLFGVNIVCNNVTFVTQNLIPNPLPISIDQSSPNNHVAVISPTTFPISGTVSLSSGTTVTLAGNSAVSVSGGSLSSAGAVTVSNSVLLQQPVNVTLVGSTGNIVVNQSAVIDVNVKNGFYTTSSEGGPPQLWQYPFSVSLFSYYDYFKAMFYKTENAVNKLKLGHD